MRENCTISSEMALPRGISSSSARAIVILAFLLSFALPLFADYRDSFSRGMQALDRKDWAGVRKHMSDAASQHPGEGERVKLYGMRFEVYLPFYYLGLANYHLGDCQGAVDAWRRADANGAVKSQGSLYNQMQTFADECSSKLEQATPPPDLEPPAPELKPPAPELKPPAPELKPPAPEPKPPAPEPKPPVVDPVRVDRAISTASSVIEQAKELAAATDRLGRASDTSGFFDGNLRQRQQQGQRLLTSSQEALQVAKKGTGAGSIENAEEAATLANRAIEEFRALEGIIDARKEEQRRARTATASARQAAMDRLEAAARNGRSAIRLVPETGLSQALSASVGELETLISRAGRLSDSASASEIDAIRQQIEQLTRSIESGIQQLPSEDLPVPAVPTPLLSGAAAYFNGDYAKVIGILANVSFESEEARFHQAMFLAAARYALYLINGGRDADLRSLARQNVKEARSLSPDVTPSRTQFSPKFIRFYEDNG
ncbi:MAG: hypothetical protein KY459_08660 [Acidobacteria bacterium]|nr:hypothetical protein [Acidobacteriota bacterium]